MFLMSSVNIWQIRIAIFPEIYPVFPGFRFRSIPSTLERFGHLISALSRGCHSPGSEYGPLVKTWSLQDGIFSKLSYG